MPPLERSLDPFFKPKNGHSLTTFYNIQVMESILFMLSLLVKFCCLPQVQWETKQTWRQVHWSDQKRIFLAFVQWKTNTANQYEYPVARGGGHIIL